MTAPPPTAMPMPRELAQARGLTLIHPFENAQVIAGQGTVGLEIAAQTDTRDADVLVCCGGGGLTAGIALALDARAPGLRVRPVEPKASTIPRNRWRQGGSCQPGARRAVRRSPDPSARQVAFSDFARRLCGPGWW